MFWNIPLEKFHRTFLDPVAYLFGFCSLKVKTMRWYLMPPDLCSLFQFLWDPFLTVLGKTFQFFPVVRQIDFHLKNLWGFITWFYPFRYADWQNLFHTFRCCRTIRLLRPLLSLHKRLMLKQWTLLWRARRRSCLIFCLPTLVLSFFRRPFRFVLGAPLPSLVAVFFTSLVRVFTLCPSLVLPRALDMLRSLRMRKLGFDSSSWRSSYTSYCPLCTRCKSEWKLQGVVTASEDSAKIFSFSEQCLSWWGLHRLSLLLWSTPPN